MAGRPPVLPHPPLSSAPGGFPAPGGAPSALAADAMARRDLGARRCSRRHRPPRRWDAAGRRRDGSGLLALAVARQGARSRHGRSGRDAAGLHLPDHRQ